MLSYSTITTRHALCTRHAGSFLEMDVFCYQSLECIRYDSNVKREGTNLDLISLFAFNNIALITLILMEIHIIS